MGFGVDGLGKRSLEDWLVVDFFIVDRVVTGDGIPIPITHEILT